MITGNKYICVLDTASNVCNVVEPYKDSLLDWFTNQDLQDIGLLLVSIVAMCVGYVIIAKSIKIS